METLKEKLLALFETYDLNYIADQQCYDIVVDEILDLLQEHGVKSASETAEESKPSVKYGLSYDHCLFGGENDECYKVNGRCAICEHSKWYK